MLIIAGIKVRRINLLTFVNEILSRLCFLGREPASAVYTALCPITEWLAQCPTPHRGRITFTFRH